MNFLEAHRIVSGFQGGEDLPFLLAASGTLDPLALFLKAVAAQRGRSAVPRTLPFNTLGQWAFTAPEPGETEVVLLLPWDFVPEADWRSGVPAVALEPAALREKAAGIAERIAERRARILYLPAATPPLFADAREDANLASWLALLAQSLGARLLPAGAFGLGSYLASGNPVASGSMATVAEAIIDAALELPRSYKVLITDLDHVMWHGVIGEDGLEGVHCGPEGLGYRHFLYQTVLAKLEREGVLVAAVSRNDEDLALAPFRAGRTHFPERSLVAMLASYNAKSAQIAELADRLSLGLDSFVFVDDNPVEIAEVSAALPAVRCVQFPTRDDDLPGFLQTISGLFSRSVVTEEDRERTELYRRRMLGVAPSTLAGADLSGFLRDLGMKLSIHDRTDGDRTRAVQLINKTNQFNLNGRRLDDEEVAAVLASGGRLLTATLEDRNGSHGEILACLVSAQGIVHALVMSCRVLQRRVEAAFLAWMIRSGVPLRYLEYMETQRNAPIRQFLADPAFSAGESGGLTVDADAYLRAHSETLELFDIEEPKLPAGVAVA